MIDVHFFQQLFNQQLERWIQIFQDIKKTGRQPPTFLLNSLHLVLHSAQEYLSNNHPSITKLSAILGEYDPHYNQICEICFAHPL
jgi:hypothetical protein